MASCVAAEAATYSASIVNIVIVDCFLLHQEIAPPASKKVFTEVDLRSSDRRHNLRLYTCRAQIWPSITQRQLCLSGISIPS